MGARSQKNVHPDLPASDVQPMTLTRLICLTTLLLASPFSWAQGQFIDIYPKTEADIKAILSTLEEAVNTVPEQSPPIVMMLHGPEAEHFLRSRYSANKSIVDLTAQLSGFGILNVQICETWLRSNQYDTNELFPFIKPVPYGEAELERLRADENFTEYDIDL